MVEAQNSSMNVMFMDIKLNGKQALVLIVIEVTSNFISTLKIKHLDLLM